MRILEIGETWTEALVLRSFFPLKEILLDTRNVFDKEIAGVNTAPGFSIFPLLLFRIALLLCWLESGSAGRLPPHTSSPTLGARPKSPTAEGRLGEDRRRGSRRARRKAVLSRLHPFRGFL